MINKSDPQQMQQFTAHFISNIEEAQSCNYATFVPLSETSPLQVNQLFLCHASKLDHGQNHYASATDNISFQNVTTMVSSVLTDLTESRMDQVPWGIC